MADSNSNIEPGGVIPGGVIGDDIVEEEGREEPAAWKMMRVYVSELCPNGTLSVKIANGIPTQLTGLTPNIRFDKPGMKLPVKLAKI